MINETGMERKPPQGLASGTELLLSLLPAPIAGLARMTLGRWLVLIGQGCLILFAVAALISANREAGLLTFGPLAYVSSAVRGGVQIGVVFLLLPVGAALWLSGRWLLWRPRSLRWRFGPAPVVVPLLILVVLTLVHLSPDIGWADVTFVLAGLGLLVLTYLFVVLDGPSGPALAGFVALVGGVQALVGIGQFVVQHDLGLRWLGELPLSPLATGVSVLDGSGRILRAYGLMRHPNALGAILPLSLLAAISLWTPAGRARRGFWLMLMVVIAAGLALSFSRSGWIAALAGVAVWLVAGRVPRRHMRRADWLAWAPALLALVLVVVGAISLQPGLFLGRFLGALGGGSGLEHGSVAERAFALQGAWALIQRWALWGVGTRQYVYVVAQLIHVAPRESLLVESTPLALWVELGLAAPLAWLGLGLLTVWLGCRPAARGDANRDLALATAWIAAIQVVCLFQPFFWPSNELWQGGIWLGLALGLWARAWTSSSGRSAAAAPAAPPSTRDCVPTPLDNNRRPAATAPGARSMP